MKTNDQRPIQDGPNDSRTDTTAHQLANAFVIAGTGSAWISATPEYPIGLMEVQ